MLLFSGPLLCEALPDCPSLFLGTPVALGQHSNLWDNNIILDNSVSSLSTFLCARALRSTLSVLSSPHSNVLYFLHVLDGKLRYKEVK